MSLSRLRTMALLAGLILAFTVAVSAVGCWKYTNYKYQGLDLAIYTNVLASLADGHGWWSSIQGGSYLGDHVEPILLILVPLFRVWSDPRLLIVAQACVLAFSVIPVAALLPPTRWRTLLLVAWLLNPLLWNAALFEFHALAFAPVLLLGAAVSYRRERWGIAALLLLLACAVREDVALMVAMMGIVVMGEGWRLHAAGSSARRHRYWWGFRVLLLGTLWFVAATRIGAAHTPVGAYKFLAYYGWLGDSFLTVILHAAQHPIRVLRHVMTIGNIDFVLGLLMPFLFLPMVPIMECTGRWIARHRASASACGTWWFLPALPPLLQVVLAYAGGSALVVEMHYGLLFLPALAIVTIDVVDAWQSGAFPVLRRVIIAHLPLPRAAWGTVSVVAYLYVVGALGPWSGIANAFLRGAPGDIQSRRLAYDALLVRVPSDAAVAVGYAALPHVAARPAAYSLGYAFLGVGQFADRPYILPESVQYLLLDTRDAVAYAVQFPVSGWAQPYAAGGPERLRAIVRSGAFRVVDERNEVALLVRGTIGAMPGDDYFAPSAPVRGYLVVDSLRDIVVERE
ncbi:DUF2079 domain-containing protein [Candidatus Uhrbacteria bacterium]|nr:DUF2079 domain-containing protein [Candidatus Uhrbacteria bacterium]